MRTVFFSNGTIIDDWFYNIEKPRLDSMGKKYILTEYGIINDGNLYTDKIQALIDLAANEGGGVIVVPEGIYRTGALFFKQGVHLYLSSGATLLGSDDPSDYPVMMTRIEGETCKYFSALINVDSIDGFAMFGEGTIDGNGLRSWKSFWLRRRWNSNCTNKDEQRPRLVYVSNCSNVTVAGLKLQNSHYWTNHIYKCHHVRFIDCSIYSPRKPVPAPSTDAIDIDVCDHVLIKGCRMEVNDDSVVLKGGKGPWADEDPNNGINENIIIEDCEMYHTHGALTCGSESVHNRNIIFRNVKVCNIKNLLWLKMRPDTPQRYEHILMENVEGCVDSFISVKPWTQFFDLKDRKDVPKSYADHITARNCVIACKCFLDVLPDEEQYVLSNILFEELKIKANDRGLKDSQAAGFELRNVTVTERAE